MSTQDTILGIWDGHDSGAALIKGDRICFAINEERLTRRKLEIRFPRRAIGACLDYAGLAPSAINEVAYSTSDFAKTLTRLLPSLKEEYYLIRRRKKKPSNFTSFKKKIKYRLTELPPNLFTRRLSDGIVKKELRSLGLKKYRLTCVGHHDAHAAAAFFSGFSAALVLTLDGIGDGLSGCLYRFESQRLERIRSFDGKSSLGIFFEHVTNLMNMRELEDEGKVMALANFAYPVPDEQNPILDLVHIEGTSIALRYPSLETLNRLKDILWQYPAEQFCYMAQRTLELRIVELIREAVAEYGLSKVILSGGVASNIKANQLIRNLPEIEDIFVFPVMGDGGLALGAAAWANYEKHAICHYELNDLKFGTQYDDGEIQAVLDRSDLRYTREKDIVRKAAELISGGEILFWFQGRMELGPRALGARSILALPNSLEIKDKLNLKLKKRVWYQPFCPSMLALDAKEVLADFAKGHPDRFMTCGYTVKTHFRGELAGVINVDGTCRPQIIDSQNGLYSQLLLEVKKRTGFGIVLNTSLNIHGEPLVCSPDDAVMALHDSGCKYLAIGNFLVAKDG
jgi:carbamoyltransferase